MPASENAIDLAALLAGPLKAEITLLGIVEKSSDEQPLREALERQAQSLRTQNAQPDIVVRAGEPVRQILDQTSSISYDLVLVGARWTGASGIIGALKEHTKSSKRYSRQCWWRSVNASS